MPWRYSQSTGLLLLNGKLIGTGYSGKGIGRLHHPFQAGARQGRHERRHDFGGCAMTLFIHSKSIGFITTMLLLTFSYCAFAKAPDCTSPDAWPAGMPFTHLKNAGSLDSANLDFSKTMVIRLASEKVDKDLYHQIHLIRFTKKSGEHVVVITANNVSSDECSMSDVSVFVVVRELGNKVLKK